VRKENNAIDKEKENEGGCGGGGGGGGLSGDLTLNPE